MILKSDLLKRGTRYFALLLCAFLCAPAAFALSAPKPEATRAENTGGAPNSSGVYPTRISWRKPTGSVFTGYHVYRSTKADTGFERISTEHVANETGNSYMFIDRNPSAAPGQPYYYRLRPITSKGETEQFSETVMGYGALTHESYMREYDKTVGSSIKKLTLMHKSGNMAKLGSEEKAGSISGNILYDAKVSGFSGRVIMKYERYADFYIENNRSLGPYFVLTVNMNTTAGMNQNGTMDGTVTVSGMYPGRVSYDNVQIKNGKAASGTYGVEPQGFPRKDVNWDFAKR